MFGGLFCHKCRKIALHMAGCALCTLEEPTKHFCFDFSTNESCTRRNSEEREEERESRSDLGKSNVWVCRRSSSFSFNSIRLKSGNRYKLNILNARWPIFVKCHLVKICIIHSIEWFFFRKQNIRTRTILFDCRCRCVYKWSFSVEQSNLRFTTGDLRVNLVQSMVKTCSIFFSFHFGQTWFTAVLQPIEFAYIFLVFLTHYSLIKLCVC